jgi:N-acetylmuramoyl-L-alanine amidase
MRREQVSAHRWRGLLICVITSVVVGCSGAPRVVREETFPALLSLQQTYAKQGATVDQWNALARAFYLFASENPMNENADDALFGAGVSFTYMRTPEGSSLATRAFQRLLNRYPDSPNIPNALYWTAKAYESLRDAPRAERYYQMLVNRYPNSRYASEAWKVLAPPPPPKPVQFVEPTKTVTPKTNPTVATAKPVETPKTTVKTTPTTQNSTTPAVKPVQDKPPVTPVPRVPDDPTLSQQLGLGVKTIVIDPGHGGHDYGATAAGRPSEKEINLDVATRLATLLENRGFKVYMTRKDDTFIPLKERNELARRWKADVFVSVHVNSAESSAGSGVETWVCSPSRDARSAQQAARENAGAVNMSEIDDVLAEILVSSKTMESKSLARQIQSELVSASGSSDRGVKEAGFVVLAGLRVPSVLVEIGFLSNPAEGKRLATPEYRQTIAEAIARGVSRYASAYVSATAK